MRFATIARKGKMVSWPGRIVSSAPARRNNWPARTAGGGRKRPKAAVDGNVIPIIRLTPQTAMGSTEAASEHGPAAGPDREAGAPEPEITAEMIEAGSEQLLELGGIVDSATLVSRVFLAMKMAQAASQRAARTRKSSK
jgi:hypothetical protein